MKKKSFYFKIFKTIIIYCFALIMSMSYKENLHKEIKAIFKEDVLNTIKYSLYIENNIINFNENIFEQRIKEITILSLKDYEFKSAKILIEYYYNEYYLEKINVCLKYQKRIIKDSVSIHYSLQYLT